MHRNTHVIFSEGIILANTEEVVNYCAGTSRAPPAIIYSIWRRTQTSTTNRPAEPTVPDE